jgi:hypothetical protein
MRLPLWRRQQREEELEEEIQSHLRIAIRDRMERGESVEEAGLAARRGVYWQPGLLICCVPPTRLPRYRLS